MTSNLVSAEMLAGATMPFSAWTDAASVASATTRPVKCFMLSTAPLVFFVGSLRVVERKFVEARNRLRGE